MLSRAWHGSCCSQSLVRSDIAVAVISMSKGGCKLRVLPFALPGPMKRVICAFCLSGAVRLCVCSETVEI